MENIPQKKFSAKVFSVDVLVQGVKKITFKLSDPFTFLPGQYVWVEIPALEIIDVRGTRRAFSICTPLNKDNTIAITARISETGYKQGLFALKVGDDVFIHGPFGSAFVLDTENIKELVLIAGGVGITPFLPTIQMMKDTLVPIRCLLVYLNEDEQHTPFIKELKKLKKDNKFFDFKVIFSRKFSFEDVKDFFLETKEDVHWWISGPQALIDLAYSELSENGVSRSDVFFENFYPTKKESLRIEDVRKKVNEGDFLTMAIQNSTNHTVVTDVNGTVLFANKAAEVTTGFSQEEIVGSNPRLWGGMNTSDFYKKFWHDKMSGTKFTGEIINRRKNGDFYYVIAHINPILNENKVIIGFIGTEEDVTVIKVQEQAVREKEFRLNSALEASRDGLWDWNILTGDVYFSPRFIEMLCFTPEELKGRIEEMRGRVHSDDIRSVEKSYASLLSGETPFYESKHRILCKNGTSKWILDRGKVIERDSSGKAVRAVGTYTDITEIKQREEDLERLNHAMVGRELKMIELKEELSKLKGRT